MNRTYVVTGAASGIGAATARRLREQGGRVIGCDLHDAEVIGDLASEGGRAAMIEGVSAASGGRIDAIIANAGGGPAETSLSLNFFGAVATLEGLRPLLSESPAPRTVAVSSIASLRPPDPCLVEACLALDEAAALAQAQAGSAWGDGLALYANAKHALNAWCRRAAIAPEWAGAGIPLNVVALGFFDTPAARYILSDPGLKTEAERMTPLRDAFPGRPEQAADLLSWCVSPQNALMTGQILFLDAGAECLARGGRLQ
jgi:NAD(P)-dependent dehydrogenase (short-subunit alcohol dehydrogenase family)